MSFIVWQLVFLTIIWTGMFVIWWRQNRYYRRMIQMGVDLVLEAQCVAKEYPNEYATYRLEAERALDAHAVGALTKLLPTTSPTRTGNMELRYHL
jgi:hypothetical protein